MASQRCLSISSDKKTYDNQVNNVWREKRKLLADSQNDLRNIRSELETDYAWNVGDPGSARELTTALALVTKTTANLVEGLGGFSTEKSVRTAMDIYENIKLGKAAYKIVTEDAGKAVLEVMFDAGSRINPVVKAAKTTKEFAENVQRVASLPGDLATARGEFKHQMDNLAAQIDAIQHKLDQLEPVEKQQQAESLFQTYQSAKQMCEGSAVPSKR
jgi:hypothetical protein